MTRAILSFFRIMFWSMWKSRHGQEGRIEYAYMDGQHRKVFLNKDITWPSGLTVDTMRGRLYFCDSFRDTIESVDIFGGPESRKVLPYLALLCSD